MKRSKLFLGFTTGILAITTIAAIKAHRFSSTSVRYYCTSNITDALCLSFSGTNVIFENGGNKLYSVTINNKVYALYVQGSLDPGAHTCATIGICKQPLLYTGAGQ